MDFIRSLSIPRLDNNHWVSQTLTYNLRVYVRRPPEYEYEYSTPDGTSKLTSQSRHEVSA